MDRSALCFGERKPICKPEIKMANKAVMLQHSQMWSVIESHSQGEGRQ